MVRASLLMHARRLRVPARSGERDGSVAEQKGEDGREGGVHLPSLGRIATRGNHAASGYSTSGV